MLNLTITNNKILSEIFLIHNNQNFRLTALWDTGATKSLIDLDFIKKLSLTDNGLSGGKIIDIFNEERQILLYDVVFTIPNHDKSVRLEVCGFDIKNKSCDFIIGMDLIQHGNFCIKKGIEFTFDCVQLK